MKYRYTYYIMLLLFSIMRMNSTFAQSDTIPFFEDINWSDYLGDNDEQASEYDLTEELEEFFYSDKAFNVNALDPKEAIEILKMSDYQYYQLQLYITKYGHLLSLAELTSVDGFTSSDFLQLKPYLYVGAKTRWKIGWKDLVRYPKQELLLRYAQVIESKAGYDTTRDNHYLGSPPQLCFRYRFQTRHLSLGLAGEKDAGEQFFRKSQKQGFDHYSFHAQLKDFYFLKTLVIGDFRANFGQGLVIGSGFLGGKGSGAAAIRKFATGIRPVTAMNEGDFLRGAAATIAHKNWQSSLFYGCRKYDGELFSEEAEEVEESGAIDYFDGSLSVNGYHRTEKELLKKRQLKNHVFGADFQYRWAKFKIGARMLYSRFSAEVLPRGQLYQLYDFSGKEYAHAAVDYHWLLGKMILFGEYGINNKGKPGLLQGLIYSPDPRVKLSALFRYYHPQFNALMGNSFGNNQQNKNELGIYYAADFLIGRQTSCALYADFYRFPWLKYRVNRPSKGKDFSFRIRQAAYKYSLEMRYQFKTTEQNIALQQYFDEVHEIRKHKWRVLIRYDPMKNISMKTELHYVHNKTPATDSRKNGWLCAQDVALNLPKYSLSFRMRLAFFDTDSYDERIYLYEHDLYYMFNISGYYYRGWRGYLMVHYSYKFMDIWLRVSQTLYLNRHQVGSGLELIDKPHKSDVKLQMLFKI